MITKRWWLLAVLVLSTWHGALADSAKRAPERITIDVIAGDYAYIPAEKTCARVLAGYTAGRTYPGVMAFKDKGFSGCKVVETKESRAAADCPNGRSIAGCHVCVLQCEY
jgi:hypothetical protein